MPALVRPVQQSPGQGVKLNEQKEIRMSTPHHYSEILHGIADGKQILLHDGSTWFEITPQSALSIVFNRTHVVENLKVKPETMLVNGVEVPAPEKNPLKDHENYWFPHLYECKVYSQVWLRDFHSHRHLENGLVHRTREAAQIHLDALLKYKQEQD